MSKKIYTAVEKNGRMYVMKPDGFIAICATAKFDVVDDPQILRKEASFIARCLNQNSMHTDLMKSLSSAEIAVEQLCQGQHSDNECWNILREIRGSIAKAKGGAA